MAPDGLLHQSPAKLNLPPGHVAVPRA